MSDYSEDEEDEQLRLAFEESVRLHEQHQQSLEDEALRQSEAEARMFQESSAAAAQLAADADAAREEEDEALARAIEESVADEQARANRRKAERKEVARREEEFGSGLRNASGGSGGGSERERHRRRTREVRTTDTERSNTARTRPSSRRETQPERQFTRQASRPSLLQRVRSFGLSPSTSETQPRKGGRSNRERRRTRDPPQTTPAPQPAAGGGASRRVRRHSRSPQRPESSRVAGNRRAPTASTTPFRSQTNNLSTSTPLASSSGGRRRTAAASTTSSRSRANSASTSTPQAAGITEDGSLMYIVRPPSRIEQPPIRDPTPPPHIPSAPPSPQQLYIIDRPPGINHMIPNPILNPQAGWNPDDYSLEAIIARSLQEAYSTAPFTEQGQEFNHNELQAAINASAQQPRDEDEEAVQRSQGIPTYEEACAAPRYAPKPGMKYVYQGPNKITLVEAVGDEPEIELEVVGEMDLAKAMKIANRNVGVKRRRVK